MIKDKITQKEHVELYYNSLGELAVYDMFDGVMPLEEISDVYTKIRKMDAESIVREFLEMRECGGIFIGGLHSFSGRPIFSGQYICGSVYAVSDGGNLKFKKYEKYIVLESVNSRDLHTLSIHENDDETVYSQIEDILKGGVDNTIREIKNNIVYCKGLLKDIINTLCDTGSIATFSQDHTEFLKYGLPGKLRSVYKRVSGSDVFEIFYIPELLNNRFGYLVVNDESAEKFHVIAVPVVCDKTVRGIVRSILSEFKK